MPINLSSSSQVPVRPSTLLRTSSWRRGAQYIVAYLSALLLAFFKIACPLFLLASRFGFINPCIGSSLNSPPLVVAAGGAEVDSAETANSLEDDDTFTSEGESKNALSMMGLVIQYCSIRPH